MPLNWPANDKVILEGSSQGYHHNLLLFLHNPIFQSQPGTKISIMDRTGAGQSSTVTVTLSSSYALGEKLNLNRRSFFQGTVR
ncbi:hypothetical protein BDV25DRAFT_159699 [Aspergillus avenaceus]|uniref:Uncharacterized protein n=1 Tax=Aspergillus avenaceus TaxID=36643 RepID=A0A5N6TN12_ASPAV|nr:hypothetical protein BDV25DRAFT_159699 [Aspergillus avenaceus]